MSNGWETESSGTSLADLINLMKSFGGGSNKDELRETSNSVSYLTNLFNTVNIDTIPDVQSAKNLVMLEKDNAPIEHREIYDVFHDDLVNKGKLIQKSKTISNDLSTFNANWIDIKYDEVLPDKIAKMTVDDAMKLQGDFYNIYNDYQNIINIFGQKTNLIDYATHQKMEKTLDSVDGAVVDLSLTKKITLDDFFTFKTAPHTLEARRKMEIESALAIYNEFTPILDRAMTMDSSTLSGLIYETTLGVEGTDAAAAIKNRLEPILGHYLDEAKVGSLTSRLDSAGKLGLQDEIEKIKKDLIRIVDSSYKNIYDWSGKTIDEIRTGDSTHDRNVELKNLTSKLISPGGVFIPDKHRKSSGEEGVDIFTTDTGNEIYVKLNSKTNAHYMYSPTTVNLGTFSNPSNESLEAASNLPDLAWSLWNRHEKTLTGYKIKDEPSSILEKRGLANKTPYGYNGFSYGMMNSFLTDLKKLDEELRSKNAVEIMWEDDEKRRSVAISDVWSGPNTKDDLTHLINLLLSNRYWINGVQVGTTANMRRRSYSNLDSRLSGNK